MKQLQQLRLRTIAGCIFGLFIMMLFTACAGVATTTNANGTTTTIINGTIVSVNASAHSATLNVGDQQVTVSGLTDQQVAPLQANQGKPYAFQATQTGNQTYSIQSNTEPQLESSSTPPEGNSQQSQSITQRSEAGNYYSGAA
jgi:hypothetical protein